MANVKPVLMIRDRRRKHGMSQSYLYTAWQHMIDRCTNPNCPGYKSYGGRGIKIGEAWRDFATFARDVGERPSSAYSLDRIDNDGNYTKDNCKWATRTEQNRNKQYHIYVELYGERMMCADAMRALSILPHGMYHRIRKFGETHQQVVDHYKTLREGQRGNNNPVA